MTIRQLVYITEIAKEKSISQAAERLFLSQPALSLQIHALEEELGYTLFDRTSKGLQLTEAGKHFCAEAQQLLDHWENFRRQVLPTEKQRRRLRVGLGARVYSNLLFPAVAAYFEKRPQLEVTFLTEAGMDAYSALREGKLDLALDRMPESEIQGPDSACSAWELIREQQCVLAGSQDHLGKRESLRFPELEKHPILTGLAGSVEDRLLQEEFRSHGIAPGRIFRSDSIDTLMRMVRSGSGIAIGPRSFASYYGVTAVPLDPPQQDSLYFACRKKDVRKPEIRAFREYLLDLCNKL